MLGRGRVVAFFEVVWRWRSLLTNLGVNKNFGERNAKSAAVVSAMRFEMKCTPVDVAFMSKL